MTPMSDDTNSITPLAIVDPSERDDVASPIDASSSQTSRNCSDGGRAVFLAGVLVATFLLTWMIWPVLCGKIYMADDLGEFHLPLRGFYANQLQRGELFDWCPDLYCGFYLTGEGQVGGYHPLHLLLYRILPLPFAFGIECWISYPLMLIGMFLFLRRSGMAREAALFGAIAFTFGSFNLLHFVHPNAIAVVAHLPWALWLLAGSLQSHDLERQRFLFAGFALLTGSQLLLGYPQYVFLSMLVEIAYACWILRGAEAQRDRIRAASFAVAAVTIGLLIGAVQLLPTLDSLVLSVRSQPVEGFATQGSLNPLNVLQLVSPYLFEQRVVGQNMHELALYCGAIPLVLAAFCLFRRAETPAIGRIKAAASITAVLALLWAFGVFGPFAWFQQHLPLVNSFRFPCRAIFIFQFAVAVLAAIGFVELTRSAAIACPTKMREFKMLWALPLASLLSVAAGLLSWKDHLATPALVLAGPVLLAIAVLLVRQAANGRRIALALIVVLCGVDLAAYGFTTNELRQSATLNEFVAQSSTPPGEPTSRVFLDRAASDESRTNETRSGDRILLKGWRRVDGYAGLEPRGRLDHSQPKALQIAGAGWRLNETNHQWVQLNNACPRAWFVSNAIVSANPAKDILELDPSSAALVDEPINLSKSQPGSVTLKIDLPGRFVLQTNAPADQLLIINESFHPGWKAEIDSNSSRPLRVNGDFIGLVVPAGTHEVALNFQPESLLYGRLASCFGLGLIVATLLWPLRAARRLPQ
jgi:hypothetical protein